MSIFRKKTQTSQYNELTDNYRPAVLPSEGLGLETYSTSDYSLNNPDFLQAQYVKVEEHTKPVLETADKHSTGEEGCTFLSSQYDHLQHLHEAEVANHVNQIARIRNARRMRTEELERKAPAVQETINRLSAEIVPLEGLRTQFRIRIGRRSLSIGSVVTVAAMVVDSLVNYNFLQSFLFSNALLLWVTVACLAAMSDASMMALGTYLSRRKEKFTSKPLFVSICVSLSMMFLLSIVATVMIRFGSMDATYGTVNAAGEFVGKSSYSLAEYGVSLATAFVTAATGLLSFCFSLDENAALVSVREEKKAELEAARNEHNTILRELALIRDAEDPAVRDEARRKSAEGQLEALRVSLNKHYSMLAIKQVKDPDFTERVCGTLAASDQDEKSAEAPADEAPSAVEPIVFPHPVVNLD